MVKLDMYETRLMEVIMEDNKIRDKQRPFTIYQYMKILEISNDVFEEKASKLIELELIKNYENEEPAKDAIKYYLYGKNVRNLIRQKNSFYLF